MFILKNRGSIYLSIYLSIWCNNYNCRKWTRWPGSKSETRLFAFHKNVEKSINPTILSSAMNKILVQTELFNLGWQPIYEKENSEFKPINLSLKNWSFIASCSFQWVGQHTHTHTHIYMYIVSSTDRLFRYVTTLQCS